MSEAKGAYAGTVLKVDLSSGKITKVPSSSYVPKFLGGRGLTAKVIWDEVSAGTKALDPENRLVFSPGALTGTNSPTNGRWNIGGLAPQHPKEYPSHSAIGGHWGAELKFAGYDALVVYGRASRPVYILIRDDDVEIRSASHLWGVDAIKAQQMLQEEVAKEGSTIDASEKPVAGRYLPIYVRCVAIGPAGENKSRIACILHDSGDAAGQGGFGGVMGSQNLKAIAVRGTKPVRVAKPKEMVELVFKVRKMIRAKAFPVIPPYGGPGGIYGGDPKILTGYVKRTDACFGCQIACRGFFYVPGIPPSQAQCVQLQMYYNWEGVGPVAPPHPDFADRKQDETTWYGVKLADQLTINSFELTGILSWLYACYKEGLLTEEYTGLPLHDFGSKEFADALFWKIAKREGEFGNLLAEGLHRAAEKLREKFGDRVWELYEQRYVAHGQREHWFYIGVAKGPADTTGFPNPVGQLLWATYTRDPYSNHSWTRIPYGDPKMSKWFYGTEAAAYPFNYDGKAQAAVMAQHRAAMLDSLGFCDWFFPKLQDDPFFSEVKEKPLGDIDFEANLYSLATGIETTTEQMLKNAERVFNLERAAQVRMGRRREDDTFNKYFFDHPDRRGNKIDMVAWEKAKDEYYTLRGWDVRTGIPTREKLEELGLKDVADELKI